MSFSTSSRAHFRSRAAISRCLASAVLLAATSQLAAEQTSVDSADKAHTEAIAPAGLLTPFETARHQTFVTTARSKPIDVLFVGDSAMEFWAQEGKAEWDRNFSSLRAANFGVQGAHTDSLLWRLQNGELDGFDARVIVLGAIGAGQPVEGDSEAVILAGNTAIVNEIRKRQPQATLVLLVVPRMSAPSLQAAQKRHFAGLANGSSIRYVDVGQPLLLSNGSFNSSMGSGRGSALNQEGYAALAQAISPVLLELLRSS